MRDDLDAHCKVVARVLPGFRFQVCAEKGGERDLEGNNDPGIDIESEIERPRWQYRRCHRWQVGGLRGRLCTPRVALALAPEGSGFRV